MSGSLKDRAQALADILREYRKQNASVLTETRVDREQQTDKSIQVAGLGLHMYFLAGMKPVPVYKVLLSNAYADTIRWSIQPLTSFVSEGMQLPTPGSATPLFFLPIEIFEAWLIINGIFGSGVHVNNGVNSFSDAAIGNLFILGFTTPEDAHDPDTTRLSRGLASAS